MAAHSARDGATRAPSYTYRRYQALGNDYIVMGEELAPLLADPARVQRLCDRHLGLGSDGILLAAPPPPGFAAAVRILNPDGSEAEKSGNGVRIFAKHCFDHGGAPTSERLRLHTLGGPVSAQLLSRERDHSVLATEMGRASFRCEDLPMSAPGEWIEGELTCGDRAFAVTAVSMGNPHAVIFTDALDEQEVRTYGPQLERHAKFPRSTNVQFVKVVDQGTVDAMIWERGAGWTLSSGSSACAVVAACVRTGRTGRAVKVRMPGGELAVSIDEQWNVEQVGTAQELMSGQVSAELLASLGWRDEPDPG
ncbi:MAG: diaminopimelate epimerase [Kofleriaceae bacterium]